MNSLPVCVVKVGGSLFQLADLADRLRSWLAQQAVAHQVLIAGGGELADVIRRADARFGLGQVTSHRLCLEVLRSTARLLAALLPQCGLCRDLDELRAAWKAADEGSAHVFCPHQFFTAWEPRWHPSPLPADWAVTSDSLAARLAEVIGASELVLLKSGDPPGPNELATEYVDEYFPRAVGGLPVRFINLAGWSDNTVSPRR